MTPASIPRQYSANAHRCGGCQPAATHSVRTIIAIWLLSRRATTVARPHAVRPQIWVPSSHQAKCRNHLCRRGLNSFTSFALMGSRAVVCVPLKPLHMRQASPRFVSSSVPPAVLGMIWSISSLPKTYFCGLWQYSQRCRARLRTRATKSFAIILIFRESTDRASLAVPLRAMLVPCATTFPDSFASAREAPLLRRWSVFELAACRAAG